MFGNLFDFNFDGKVSIWEDALGMAMLDDMDEEEQRERQRRESCFDTDILDDEEQNEDDDLLFGEDDEDSEEEEDDDSHEELEALKAQVESECAGMRTELSAIVAALAEQKTALEVLLETRRNVIDLFPEKYYGSFSYNDLEDVISDLESAVSEFDDCLSELDSADSALDECIDDLDWLEYED